MPSVTVGPPSHFYRRSRIVRRSCDDAIARRSPPTPRRPGPRGTDFRASACRAREISAIKSAHAAYDTAPPWRIGTSGLRRPRRPSHASSNPPVVAKSINAVPIDRSFTRNERTAARSFAARGSPGVRRRYSSIARARITRYVTYVRLITRRNLPLLKKKRRKR